MKILFYSVFLSFLFGFLIQGKVLKSRVNLNGYQLFLWTVKHQINVMLFGIDIRKETRKYKELCKQPLDISKLIYKKSELIELLSSERNEKKMKKRLDIILEKQEAKRRLVQKEGNAWTQAVFFVPNLVIKDGNFKGFSLQKIISSKVQYNRFKNGLPTSSFDIIFSVSLFGNEKEKEIIKFEDSFRREEEEVMKRFWNYKIQRKKKVE